MGAPSCSVCPSQDGLPVSSPCPAVFLYWFLFSEQQLHFEVLSLLIGYAAFDDAKAQGYAGFPALLLDDDRVILDESKLKEIF